MIGEQGSEHLVDQVLVPFDQVVITDDRMPCCGVFARHQSMVGKYPPKLRSPLMKVADCDRDPHLSLHQTILSLLVPTQKTSTGNRETSES